jgi:glycosyltransferase involved in cell wall biosynthesis
MSSNPLISVTLISMNHEKFIEQAVTSIINQSYQNIEVIFLDNNSKDKTFEIAESLLKKSTLKYTCIKNVEDKGVSENLNTQVKLANGEFISVISGDDWFEKDDIETRLRHLQKNNLDVIYANGNKFIDNLNCFQDLYTKQFIKQINTIINNCFQENIAQNLLFCPGFFVKKQILIENEFDVNIDAEDWDINLRLARKNYQFGFVNKKLFNYRILTNSLSNNYEKMEKSYFQITDKYLDEIKKNPKAKKKYDIKLIEFRINKIKQNENNKYNQKKLLEIYKELNFIKYNLPKRFYKNLINYFRYLLRKL